MSCATPWAAVLSIEVIMALPAPLIRLGAKKMMRTTVTIHNSNNRKNLLITTVSSLHISVLFDTIINDKLTHVYIIRKFDEHDSSRIFVLLVPGRGQAIAPTMDDGPSSIVGAMACPRPGVGPYRITSDSKIRDESCITLDGMR